MQGNLKQREFQQLVDELVKVKPNQSRVRNLTLKLGLPYKMDPIEQLDFVLKSANGFFFENRDNNPKRSEDSDLES